MSSLVTTFIKLNNTSKPTDAAQYLCTLPSIRERCTRIFELARNGDLDHFKWHEGSEGEVVDYCARIIERDFGKDYAAIPPHGRRNHFISLDPPIDRIQILTSLPSYPAFDPTASTKSLLDLYMVSVLLDAGAGSTWKYTECDLQGKPTGFVGGRSEGLAVASYAMFVQGVFSSDPVEHPFRVDANALVKLSAKAMEKGLQISSDNQMEGLEGRCDLLVRLGHALRSKTDHFATGRPGDMLDFFIKEIGPYNSGQKLTLPIASLWAVLISLLSAVWPPRLELEGQPLGDVWKCNALERDLKSREIARSPGDDLVPFHKLSQWLCYSLIQPIESVAGWKVEGWQRDMTGLPEYRNGGLLLDLGVLELRGLTNADYPNGLNSLPKLKPNHPAIIEWRALTVISLDRIADQLRSRLGIDDPAKLTLAQVLEAATWKGGREVAMRKRGKSGGGPPIEIESDGTVF